MSLFRIAIDGPAASGKSTTAKLLAKTLGFGYIDSGAMYRAITLKCLDLGLDVKDASTKDTVVRVAREAQIRFPSLEKVELDGQDVSNVIRESRIVRNISHIASNGSVRAVLAEQQRALARGDVDQGWSGFSWQSKQVHGVVMDGRDIGTVILPDAELKVFLVADPQVRAQRRFDELLKKHGIAPGETVQDIARDLAQRDEADRTRAVSPLKKASDAVELDTSHMSIADQVDAIKDLVIDRLPRFMRN